MDIAGSSLRPAHLPSRTEGSALWEHAFSSQNILEHRCCLFSALAGSGWDREALFILVFGGPAMTLFLEGILCVSSPSIMG